MKNHDSPLARLSIEEAPKLDLKALPSYFRYVFLWRGGTLHVIIAKDLNVTPVETLVSKRINGASGWTITNIIGIPLDIFSHKIQLMLDHKPSIENQRRLNWHKQEAVKNEIIKWLDVGVIYPIVVVVRFVMFSVCPKKVG